MLSGLEHINCLTNKQIKSVIYILFMINVTIPTIYRTCSTYKNREQYGKILCKTRQTCKFQTVEFAGMKYKDVMQHMESRIIN